MMIEKIQGKYLGIAISIAIVLAATGMSYFTLNSLYTEGEKENIEEPNRFSTDKEGAEGSIVASPQSQAEDQADSFEGNIPFISLGIGISMGVISLVMWQVGRQKSGEGDPVSMLMHRGLEDLTVRDLNITRRMMNKEKFTIPELLDHTSASRQSVWRLVKKLNEEGLLEETGEKRLPKSGRGKPSQIYRYVGPDFTE